MEEAWMKFEVTGSITDYLKFKGIETESVPQRENFSAALRNEWDGTEYYSDRNGLKCDADWRL